MKLESQNCKTSGKLFQENEIFRETVVIPDKGLNGKTYITGDSYYNLRRIKLMNLETILI